MGVAKNSTKHYNIQILENTISIEKISELCLVSSIHRALINDVDDYFKSLSCAKSVDEKLKSTNKYQISYYRHFLPHDTRLKITN